MRRRALAWLLGGVLALAAAAVPVGVIALREMAGAPLRLTDRDFIVVAPGATLTSVATDLGARGTLPWPRAFLWWARLGGRGGHIVAGEYLLRPGANGRSLLEDLEGGRVVMHALRVREGIRVREMLAELWASGMVRPTLKGQNEAEIMTALGTPGLPAEGRFLPETYYVTRGESDFNVLARARQALDQTLEKAWAARTTDVYATSDQALTMASIVEKETGHEDERRQVAGVFARRLRIGMPLQADPTVIYGLGDAFDGDLLREHLRSDTPWNTYTRKGLPQTPIALPSRASIHAALDPLPGAALYFVARGDGTHVFSADLEAHNTAVQRYQRRRALPDTPPDTPTATPPAAPAVKP